MYDYSRRHLQSFTAPRSYNAVEILFYGASATRMTGVYHDTLYVIVWDSLPCRDTIDTGVTGEERRVEYLKTACYY